MSGISLDSLELIYWAPVLLVPMVLEPALKLKGCVHIVTGAQDTSEQGLDSLPWQLSRTAS